MTEEAKNQETERDVVMKEIELDLDEEIIEKLLDHAKENILGDKDALINWAVNDILKQIVEENKKGE